MTRKWWFMAAAGVAVAVGLGAGTLVMAQQSNQNAGTTFLDRVAQKLGIETPKLQDAVKSAANDEVDAAVQRGDLTQQQADKIKQQIANGKLPGFNGPLFNGRGGPGPKAFGFGFGFGFFGAEPQKLADFLHISQDQLKTELQADGATLAKVADAHGKSRDDLKTIITDEAKSKLDQAVSNCQLTPKQANTMLEGLKGHLDQLIDASPPRFKGRFFKPGMKPGMGPPAMPGTAPTPSTGAQFDAPGGFRSDRGVTTTTYTY